MNICNQAETCTCKSCDDRKPHLVEPACAMECDCHGELPRGSWAHCIPVDEAPR